VAGVTDVAVTETDCTSEFQTGWGLPAYITWVTLSIYILPIVALISVYSRICLAVWHSERFNRAVSRAGRPSSSAGDDVDSSPPAGRRRRTEHGSPATSTTVSAAKVKTVKLTLVVVVSYVICYGPWFLVQMWAAWDEDAPYEGTWPLRVTATESTRACFGQ